MNVAVQFEHAWLGVGWRVWKIKGRRGSLLIWEHSPVIQD